MKNLTVKCLLCMIFFFYLTPVMAADPVKGGEVYANNCYICHGDDGQGVVPNAPNFKYGDRLIKPDTELFQSISSGMGLMPAFRGILSEQDILDVISYLRTF